MDLNEFTLMVCDKIKEYLSAYDFDEIYEREVVKNNGVIYKGLVISKKEKDAAPTIYMDYYYGLYKQGKSIDSIVRLIFDNYKDSIKKLEFLEEHTNDLMDYKDKLFIKVVNYEKNKLILEDCPFVPFQDMAITFRYLVHKDERGVSSTIVKNVLMDSWGLNTHSLYKIAYENTGKLFPPMLKKMSDIISLWSPREVFIPENDIYVLTNESGINGASNIIYKEILDDFCQNKSEEYYIIPSSIHELVLIPKGLEEDADSLKMFIKEVNKYVIPKVDFLSDNLFIYNKKAGMKIV
ncbi:MAG: hypothetical protein IJ224_09120 [Lachnospiraceae bacterium]|nr:hypothetical protein [Lachnospiraceae bacterium]